MSSLFVTKIPGAINLTVDELTNDMIIGVASPAQRSSQTTLENLAAFISLIVSGGLFVLRVVTAAGNVTVTADEPGVAINKTVGAPTVVLLPTSLARNAAGGIPVQIKDLKGDAGTNNITIAPAGSETIEHLSAWTLASDGGFMWLYPLPDNTGWYIGATGI